MLILTINIFLIQKT